ncbi:hypothetical protein ACFWFZ_33090 [Streptomyces sp. NPDC060232]|uniref:hypothetical protein n=1 Tax=Streptomyces sp. NPDC060232 TaxID=3347079 RepID=UPI003658CF38
MLNRSSDSAAVHAALSPALSRAAESTSANPLRGSVTSRDRPPTVLITRSVQLHLLHLLHLLDADIGVADACCR